MRPSLSVLEPGLERGVPWGRDLYTFVTSAAGHMMRTLQKPRKSRPSKRQVNHRRFLHNMIQRKFADIEAANHRLSSTLYFKEEEKHTSTLLSHKQDTANSPGNTPKSYFLLDSEKCDVQNDTEGISTRTDISVDSNKAEIRVETRSDFGHGWKSHHKSNFTTQMNKRRQKKQGTQKQSFIKDKDHFQEAELLFEPINNLSDNPQTPPDGSSANLFNQNENKYPSFSSELSPLSLDSCDFSVQMFSDYTACSQDPKTISEEQLTDMVDLFSVEDSYSENCVEAEDFFDSSGPCQDEDLPDDIPGGEHKYRYSYSCQEDQNVTSEHLEEDQGSSRTPRQKEHADENHLNNIQPSQNTDINSNLRSTSTSCSYNVTQLHLQESQFHNLTLTPFEGVAQSFFAPPHHHEHRPIPTPPPEDDWLFTDILKDRQFPY